MKGAFLDWVNSVLDRISINKILGYANRYELEDLHDDDLVTKYLLVNTAGGGTVPPDPTTITAGVTENPLTVAFEGNASGTLYSLRRVSDDPDVDDWFDWNTKVQYDGSNFVITGDDDGTGKFADSFIFGIRP